MARKPRSEFAGKDTASGRPANPQFMGSRRKLTASDRLTLGYRTDMKDARERLDRRIWLGGDPDRKVIVPKSKIKKP